MREILLLSSLLDITGALNARFDLGGDFDFDLLRLNHKLCLILTVYGDKKVVSEAGIYHRILR